MAEIKNKYNSSFGIVRANPRISGNVKITIDSKQGLWLNSIDSNDQLSRSIYKGFKISSNSDYCQDLYRFFDRGKTPEEFVFGVKGENSQVETFVSDYSDQYDGFYTTGVTPLISDIYTEEFSYLAPFWLGKKIPEYFVIYRIDDPIDFSYINEVNSLEIGKSYKVIGSDNYYIISSDKKYTSGSIFIAEESNFSSSGEGSVVSLDPNYNYNLIGNPDEHFNKRILAKSSIVKTYDMSENSEIGKYLRKIQASSNYKEHLVDARFEENIMTYFNGVNYSSGVYDSKGEYLYDFYINPTTQIEFDEFITNGFSRNGIISYKYINLEFLFNDDEAPLYSINRYFGVFVDEIPTGSFRLDGNKFFTDSYIVGNSPEPKAPSYISDTLEDPFYQNNINGVRLFMDEGSKFGYLPSSDIVNDNPRLYYVKDNEGNFYSYKRIVDYTNNNSPYFEWDTNLDNRNQLVLSNKSVDLSKFTGFTTSKIKQFDGKVASIKGHPYMVIKIGGGFDTDESIVIYHPLGSKIINGKKCDIIIASDMSTVVDDWGPGSYYNLGDSIYFHPEGSNTEIAKSIHGAINSITYRGFQAFLFGEEIVIRTYGGGYNYNFSYSIDCYTDLENTVRMDRPGVFSANGVDSLDFRNEQFFIGGTDHIKNRIMIKLEDSYKITPGVSMIRTTDGISVIENIFSYVDEVKNTSRNDTLNHYKTHAILTYRDYIKNVKIGYLGKIIVEEIYDNTVGIFSMYPVRDFDYDFWASDYNVTPTEEYYRYLDLQPNGVSKIVRGQTYCVNKGAIVRYEGNLYGVTDVSPSNFTFVGNEDNYFELISTSPDIRFNVIPLAFTKNQLTGALNGNPEPLTDLDLFSGFSGIQDIKFIDDANNIQSKKDQMYFGKLNTEYDVLKENYIKNFATKSRITPYISKWVYDGGSDARGNEYRLNVHHAFTPFNFSPSFFSTGRDPRYFTHEWYLLETPRIDSPDSLVKNSKNYCSSLLDLDSLKNSDPSSDDYFQRYFTIDGKDFYDNLGSFESSIANSVSEKYTLFKFNDATGYSETLFRGVKIKIKARTDSSVQTGERGIFKQNDKTYDGYKFACLIRPIDDPDPYTPTPPVTYKVYENKSFRTITFVISIVNNDSRFIDGYKFWNKLNVSPSMTGGSWEFNPTGIYGGLDYMGLYSLDDKLSLESITDNPDYGSVIADIKLSAGLNFSFTPGVLNIPPLLNNSTYNGTGIIPIIRNLDYNTDLRDEINTYYLPTTPITGSGSPYNPLSSPPLTSSGTNEDGFYTFYSPRKEMNDNWYTLPWPVGAGREVIYFNQVDPFAATGSYIPNFTNLGFPPPIFSVAPVNVNYNDIAIKAVYQRNGGLIYWKKLLEKISFADISQLLNNEDPYVKYYTYYWNEDSKRTEQSSELFVIECSMPSAFIQNTSLYPTEDLNKPQSLAKLTIGYNLAVNESTNEFYRYGGGYNPKFRDIIQFSNFKDDFLEGDLTNINIELFLKTVNSKYSNIGSDYEIYVNGVKRNTIRLMRGKEYTFNFVNFHADGYNPSPSEGITAELCFSTVMNNGELENLFTKGVVLQDTGDSIKFLVPYDVPNTLYYELKGSKYAGGYIKIVENLDYKNTKIGLEKDNFGMMKNLSYNKYSEKNPFAIDPNSGYKPVYPLIGESPFDIRDMFVFESTWDPGRYRNYISKDSYQLVPGTNLMREEKNYFGSKVMKTPGRVNLQKQTLYPQPIEDVTLASPDLYPGYEILWEETDASISAQLLIDRSLIRYFDSNGVGETFVRLLLPEFGTGDKSTLSDDIDSYLSLNVVPTFKADKINVYIKKIKKDPSIDLFPIVVDMNDYEKIANGFYLLDQIRAIEVDHLRYQFTFTKDPGFDYQIAFSYNLSKI